MPRDHQNDSATSLDPVSLSCHGRSGRRWFCVWTHPNREHQAVRELRALGFETYLPLCLSNLRLQRNAMVPLFPRYGFVVLAPDSPWGEILRHAGRTTTGAVAGIIRHAPDRPTPLPPGVIENLIARTSPRGIVDDPGDIAPHSTPHAAQPPEWQNITSLGSSARVRLLCRLFGPDAAQRIVSEDETAHVA